MIVINQSIKTHEQLLIDSLKPTIKSAVEGLAKREIDFMEIRAQMTDAENQASDGMIHQACIDLGYTVKP